MVKHPTSGEVENYVVPDILICILDLHKELLNEHTRLSSLLQNGKGWPAPFGFRPKKWSDDIYWDQSNSPVWEAGKVPLVFHWHMEPYWPTCKKGYSLSITDMHNIQGATCLTIYTSEALGGLIKRKYTVEDLVRPNNFDASAVMRKKSQFAGFLYRNCGFFLDSIVRTFFFELLSRQYKKVLPMSDCMGKHRTTAEAGAMKGIAKDAHDSFNGK
jgi:hypothetical protein